MLIGGLAIISHGYSRTTLDVDATLSLGEASLEELLKTLQAHEIGPRQADSLDFARRHQVLKLRHGPSGTPVNVSLAWLPFELEAIARAHPVDFDGVAIPTVTVEDQIVYKAIAWRPRDQDDLHQLLVLHGGRLNLPKVREWIRQFAEDLDTPERLAEFDALVLRARGTEDRSRHAPSGQHDS